MTESELLLIQMSGELKFEASFMGKNEIGITTIAHEGTGRANKIRQKIGVGTRLLIGDPAETHVVVVVIKTIAAERDRDLVAYFAIEPRTEPSLFRFYWNPLWILRSRDD